MVDLTRDSAVESVPNMDSFARIGIMYQTFSDPKTFGPYVKHACEAGREQGIYVDSDGVMKAEPGTGVTPEQSAANILAAVANDPQAGREIDSFLKGTDLKPRLVEFAIQALYDTGRVVRIEIVDPDADDEEAGDAGDDFGDDDGFDAEEPSDEDFDF